MKPRKPIKRGAPPKRRKPPARSRKPIPPRRRDPAKRAWAKHRCKPFREWVVGFPCLLHDHPDHLCEGEVEPSHVGSRGAGHDDIGEIIPLCSGAHRLDGKAWHNMGRHSFAKYWGYGQIETLQIIATAYGKIWLATPEGVEWRASHPGCGGSE